MVILALCLTHDQNRPCFFLNLFMSGKLLPYLNPVSPPLQTSCTHQHTWIIRITGPVMTSEYPKSWKQVLLFLLRPKKTLNHKCTVLNKTISLAYPSIQIWESPIKYSTQFPKTFSSLLYETVGYKINKCTCFKVYSQWCRGFLIPFQNLITHRYISNKIRSTCNQMGCKFLSVSFKLSL